jgi:hypothetical protein
VATGERFWLRRMRWRLRGAWVWPAFVAFTALDAVLMHALPPSSSNFDPIFASFVATLGNLFLIGVAAPWLARRLERRPRAPGEVAPPYDVFVSRSATALLALATVGLVAAGLASRPLVVSETRDTEAAAGAVSRFLSAHGTEEERANRDTANTLRLAEDYFRICVARDDRRLASCFFVETDREPPRVTRDADQRPNALMRP